MARMWFMLRNVFETKKFIFLSSLLVLSWELPVSQCPQYWAMRHADHSMVPLGLTSRLLSICSGSTVPSPGRACPCPLSWGSQRSPPTQAAPQEGLFMAGCVVLYTALMVVWKEQHNIPWWCCEFTIPSIYFQLSSLEMFSIFLSEKDIFLIYIFFFFKKKVRLFQN